MPPGYTEDKARIETKGEITNLVLTIDVSANSKEARELLLGMSLEAMDDVRHTLASMDVVSFQTALSRQRIKAAGQHLVWTDVEGYL